MPLLKKRTALAAFTLAAVAGGLLNPAAASARGGEFRGRYAGTYSIGRTLTVQGTGAASMLGPSVISAHLDLRRGGCTRFHGAISVLSRWGTAQGITLQAVGRICPSPADMTIAALTGRYSVTRGMGGFAGASGAGSLRGSIGVGASAYASLTLEGTLALPGDVAPSVPTIPSHQGTVAGARPSCPVGDLRVTPRAGPAGSAVTVEGCFTSMPSSYGALILVFRDSNGAMDTLARLRVRPFTVNVRLSAAAAPGYGVVKAYLVTCVELCAWTPGPQAPYRITA